MADADTLEGVLESANPNKIADALRAAGISGVLKGAIKETLVVGGVTANSVILASKALVIENVYDDTDSKSLFVIPTGKAAVDDVSCAISADRTTLLLNAAENGNTVIVTYVPVADITAAGTGF